MDDAIVGVEQAFDQMIAYVIGRGKHEEEAEESLKQNPFLAAGRRGVERLNFPRADEGDAHLIARDAVADEDEARALTARDIGGLDQG